MVELSDSEPDERSKVKHDASSLRATPTRKRTMSQTSQTFRSFTALLAEASKKNSRPAASKKLDSSPKDVKASKEGQQSDKEVLSKI
ncbi:hypothetical protein D8674_013266 [Pyrus ussuriensis x Pyrus communis]|uniref:Uncharacterized protein n=1 Tax=Pyrus ussuriensis x Pyrus communis TaxID=2448454 RepID=A0A5N5GQH9_9ROSA|nr:hypothetical protein D8674_013266 [Pyrus ussuriensis x Pyrus communis]